MMRVLFAVFVILLCEYQVSVAQEIALTGTLVSEQNTDLDHAKAICDRHQIYTNLMYPENPNGDVLTWSDGWNNCQGVHNRWEQSRSARAATTAAEKEHQDHMLVDKIAAGQ